MSDALTPDDLILKAEALAEEKTPDFWALGEEGAYQQVHDYIAASRTLVPALASALREAGEKNAGLEKQVALQAEAIRIVQASEIEQGHAKVRQAQRAETAESALAAANRRINGLVEECAVIVQKRADFHRFADTDYGVGARDNCDIAAEAIRALASTPAPAQETKT